MEKLEKGNPLQSNLNFFFLVKNARVVMKMKPGMLQMIIVAL